MVSSDGQDYQIKGLLGQGTQGKVWDATLKRSGKSVVIKCLHQQHVEEVNSKNTAKREQAKLFWRAFRNEIDILEACSGHPNIVKLVGRSPDYSQFMMERADMDLTKCLKVNRERLALGQCFKWFKDILVGVEHLHSIGVTHTDLKPENMLIGSDNQIKICDFGMGQKASKGTMWAVTGELSTLWYRAPELLLGCKTFGDKIDEWAVGCIVMEMLCGMTVFQGLNQGTCQCPEVTHRNFNSDQLGKILQVAGTPTSLSGLACAGHIKDWPVYQRQIEPVVRKYCQAKRLPTEHPDANGNVQRAYHSSTLWSQAIGGLLTIAPNERLTCRHILALPLFKEAVAPFSIQQTNGPPAAASKAHRDSLGGMMPRNPGVVQGRQALQQAVSQQNVIMQGTG